MNRIVVYPRGFVGFDIGLPVKKQTTNMAEQIRNARYNKTSGPTQRTVISNQDIDSLYLGMVRGERTTKNLEYIEAVLRASLAAFGTVSFFEWCAIQEKSPYFTDLHRKFLNDTFRFIHEGRRQTSVRTWIQILKVREPTVEDFRTEYLYREFFRLDQPSLFQRPLTVDGIVAAWTAQPGGLVDMLSSLRLFFGDTEHD